MSNVILSTTIRKEGDLQKFGSHLRLFIQKEQELRGKYRGDDQDKVENFRQKFGEKYKVVVL